MTGNTGEKRAYQETPGGKFIKGNPGKPKGVRHLTTKILEAIVKVSEGEDGPEDVLIVRKLIEQAKKGDMQAMKLLFNYVDGMPAQALELTGADGGAIEQSITVTFVRPE